MLEKRNLGRKFCVKGFFVLLLLTILLLGDLGSFDCSAANKYGTFVGRKPDTYTINGDTVYFYPKKIYYSGKKVVCYVYVVNKTGKKITGLSDTTLTIKNENNKVIAKHTFSAKKDITIGKDKYKTVKYVFPASSVKRKKFYFKNAKKISIKASFVFYPA